MVADFLRLDGWDVQYPGGNLSIGHVIELLGRSPPDLIAISVTMAANLPDASDLITAIRERNSLRRLTIAVGGQAFPSESRLWQDIGADGTAENAAAAVERCNSLVGRRSAPAAGGAPSRR